MPPRRASWPRCRPARRRQRHRLATDRRVVRGAARGEVGPVGFDPGVDGWVARHDDPDDAALDACRRSARRRLRASAARSPRRTGRRRPDGTSTDRMRIAATAGMPSCSSPMSPALGSRLSSSVVVAAGAAVPAGAVGGGGVGRTVSTVLLSSAAPSSSSPPPPHAAAAIDISATSGMHFVTPRISASCSCDDGRGDRAPTPPTGR